MTRKNPPPYTPAHAVSSMKTFRVPPVTGIPARPRRNSAIPVAADPAIQGKKHVTAAATGPVAINPSSDPAPCQNFFIFFATMTGHPKIFDPLKDYMEADSR
jgi:hypothetical protein